jgi:hypothetical protein
MGPFAREMYALYIYAEERSILDKLAGSPFRDSLAPLLPTKDMSSAVDDVFRGLFTLVDHPGNSNNPQQEEPVLFHTLSILRRIPLRQLYAFSGWQATAAEVDAARGYLESRLRAEETRWCVWHAGQVLDALRGEGARRFRGCVDPFYLLIAVLVLWAVDVLSVHDVDEASGGWDGDRPPTRIDRIRGFDEARAWVGEKGRGGSVHVTNIGVLQGPESARRLLAECRRIMRSGVPWSGVSCGIADALERLLDYRVE